VKPLRRCRSRRHRCAESASPAVWACEFQRRDHADRGIGLLKSRRTMLAYADDWTRCQGFKLVCVSIVTHCCSAKSCRLRESAWADVWRVHRRFRAGGLADGEDPTRRTELETTAMAAKPQPKRERRSLKAAHRPRVTARRSECRLWPICDVARCPPYWE
jgi:hypothetical protein